MSHSTAKPKCPGCHQKGVKPSAGQSVVCQSCSKEKRRVFRFCWDCQREWSCISSPNSSCALPDCALRAALLSGGQICDPNSSAKGCPYFRACPNCKALLTHSGQGCPMIHCPECATKICFRCLRPDCFGFNFYLALASTRFGQRLAKVEQCAIVDNSQSLIALR